VARVRYGYVTDTRMDFQWGLTVGPCQACICQRRDSVSLDAVLPPCAKEVQRVLLTPPPSLQQRNQRHPTTTRQ
jgi:hypothetical protein